MKPMALTRRLPDLPPLRQAPPEVYPHAARTPFSLSGGMHSAIPDNPERCRADRKAPRFPVTNPNGSIRDAEGIIPRLFRHSNPITVISVAV